MNEKLKITTDEGDIVYIHLCPNKTPIAYQRKKKEHMDFGMTEQETEKHLLCPIPVELFYDYSRGLFGVESEALDSCEIYNPYTGEEIPNDNLINE